MKKWGSLDGFEVYWVYTTQKNHETHVSFVSDFILSHYCVTDRWFLSNCSNLKIFLLVEKKGDYLYFFEVSEVQTCQKNHETHVSFVLDLIFIIALPIANVLAITRSFYWLRKSGTASTDLKSMGCIQLEKIKIHMSHMSQIWNCPIFARPIDCFYVVHWITFYWLLKRGQPCPFWSLLGPDKSKNHETHVSVSYVSD